RAIAAQPALLLADEPTARLDEANSRAIAVLFARLAAETGTAIVCATHHPVLTEQADAEIALTEPLSGRIACVPPGVSETPTRDRRAPPPSIAEPRGRAPGSSPGCSRPERSAPGRAPSRDPAPSSPR